MYVVSLEPRSFFDWSDSTELGTNLCKLCQIKSSVSFDRFKHIIVTGFNLPLDGDIVIAMCSCVRFLKTEVFSCYDTHVKCAQPCCQNDKWRCGTESCACCVVAPHPSQLGGPIFFFPLLARNFRVGCCDGNEVNSSGTVSELTNVG